MYKSIAITLLILISLSCDHSNSPSVRHGNSIILFIGDGMGAEQRKAAQWYSYGLDGKLVMDSLPYTGLSMTHSANNLITDSAAGATAISTGMKTNNGVIALDPSLNELTTILELAKSKGMSTGLVTTTQITHATPAAFASHVESRNMMTEIALQMMNSGVEVLLGGGEDEFLPDTQNGHYPEPGERTDDRDLIAEAISNGYSYVYDDVSFSAINVNTATKILGLFSDEGMVRPFVPSIASMTNKAIDILKKNPNGFFLVVEGGQIDWAGHANDALNNILDTVAFDEAVSQGIKFAETDLNTLLIVTADHETGGMSLDLISSGQADEDGPYYMPDQTSFYVNWSSSGHTGVDVPVSSTGPLSELLVGVFENTYVFEAMKLHLQ